ncbi:MAG: hypothetical protein JNL58_06035 [Planctomyces sp.]|nr:hypothetical protein [Planctomyces sp.]
MAKIESSELHRTPGGSNGFRWQLQAATQCARQFIAELNGSRKPDMAASGAIHGLALLAREASRRSLPVSESEVDYWKEVFFKWFESVKRYFPEPLRDEFKKKAEADFAVIREAADIRSDTPWEQLRDRYERPIRFQSREKFDLACDRAKAKYPVNLGIALDKYLAACVQRLLDEDDIERPLVVKVKETLPADRPGSIAVRFITFDDGVHSLIVTSFGGLQRPANSGLGLQKAVQQLLRKTEQSTLEQLEFDSESSMFSVRSKSLNCLATVSQAVFSIAASAKGKCDS